MIRRPRHPVLLAAYATAALVAGVATAAAGFVLSGGVGGAGSGAEPIGPPIRVAVDLPSREVFFGDVVQARVEVIVDRARIHEVPVVHARFSPYSVASRRTTTESLGAEYERRIETFELRCLQAGCLPPASSRRVFEFPQVHVSAQGQPDVIGAWPPLVVVSRLYGAPGLRTSGLRSPAVVGGHGGMSSWLVWSSGGLAALGAVVLAVWALRRPGRFVLEPAAAGSTPRPDPVLDACSRVRAGLVGEGWARQRAALDRLARVLTTATRPALAAEARHLAWRRERPTDGEVRRLLDRVERRTGASEDARRDEAA